MCAVVCALSRKAECVPTFARESERGPFVQEVEKHDERWSEIELLPIVRVHREPGNVCIQKRGGIRVTNTAYRVITLVAQDCAVAEGGEAPVSPRGPFVPEVLKSV